MFFENGRMQWVFRTQSGKEWRVYGNHMLTGRWYHVTVTWQAETGLKMMVNGQMVDRQTLFVQRY
ncbi:hypothetical protein DPMN_031320 [Dreissena polymorpha]|uniref:Uncharacterized protein n=1 Tax=Dreissena polymorpha TaxID=45954 RepID=A0A9D4M1N9_DREPO|nr:hypothetical protein DPMN_031320 [Dreissena polymorpha]